MGDEHLRVADLIWPRMWRPYTLPIGIGRLMHGVRLVIGSMGVTGELIFWHRRWDHLASFLAIWASAAVFGRFVRAVLARE